MNYSVTINLELTEEDLAAARHHFLPGWTKAPQLSPQDVVDQLLRPALQNVLHRWRSRKKWDDGKFWKKLPKLRRTYTPLEGSWDCDKSPTQVCWYDDQTDSAWDECLFCGQPHERK